MSTTEFDQGMVGIYDDHKRAAFRVGHQTRGLSVQELEGKYEGWSADEKVITAPVSTSCANLCFIYVLRSIDCLLMTGTCRLTETQNCTETLPLVVKRPWRFTTLEVFHFFKQVMRPSP